MRHVAFDEGDDKGLGLGSCTSQMNIMVLYTKRCVDYCIRFSWFKCIAHNGQFEFERSTQTKHNANNDHTTRVITTTTIAQSNWEVQEIETKWQRKRLWCKVGHSSFMRHWLQYGVPCYLWREDVAGDKMCYYITFAWYSNIWTNVCVIL